MARRSIRPAGNGGGDDLATIQDLSGDNLLKLLKRLTLYADRKLVRLRWRGIQGGAPPRGIQAEDLAAEAITRVIEGKRAWDQQEQPDVLQFLKGIVDSLVSQLVNSFDNRRTRRLGPTGVGEEGSAAPTFAGRELDPAQFVADREAAERFRAPILKALEGDAVASQVFECLEADITKPSEIAEYLGISVTDINNAQKRLWRKVENALNLKTKGKPNG